VVEDNTDEFSEGSTRTQRIKATAVMSTQRSIFNKEEVGTLCNKNVDLL
jgi:hypothetical protein